MEMVRIVFQISGWDVQTFQLRKVTLV
jgi:hypothetical protein